MSRIKNFIAEEYGEDADIEAILAQEMEVQDGD